MSITVILEASIKPEHKSPLISLLSTLLPDTRAYPGLKHISIHVDESHQHVLFYEEWDKPESYQAYLNWRNETGVMTTLSRFFIDEPKIRYFTPQSI